MNAPRRCYVELRLVAALSQSGAVFGGPALVVAEAASAVLSRVRGAFEIS